MIRSTLLELIASHHLGLVLILIKVSMIFGLGFLVAHLLRHRSAAVRHFIWTSTLLGALAVPLVSRVAPQWKWPVITDQITLISTSVTPETPSSVLPDQRKNDPVVNVSPAHAKPTISSYLSVMILWTRPPLCTLARDSFGMESRAQARRASP